MTGLHVLVSRHPIKSSSLYKIPSSSLSLSLSFRRERKKRIVFVVFLFIFFSWRIGEGNRFLGLLHSKKTSVPLPTISILRFLGFLHSSKTITDRIAMTIRHLPLRLLLLLRCIHLSPLKRPERPLLVEDLLSPRTANLLIGNRIGSVSIRRNRSDFCFLLWFLDKWIWIGGKFGVLGV